MQTQHTPPKGKKGALDTRHAGIIENLRDGLKGGENGGESQADYVRQVRRARVNHEGGTRASVNLL